MKTKVITTIIAALFLASTVMTLFPLSVKATPTLQQIVNFEATTPGISVEGLGTVNPYLNIDATYGTAIAVAEVTGPLLYGAPNTAHWIVNGGLNGVKGFGDLDAQKDRQPHHYVFTFLPGMTVSRFSITMYDYGDWNPWWATYHEVKLIAYDDGNVVDDDVLSFHTLARVQPRSSYNPNYGDLYLTGDAINANVGDPGVWTFTVEGTNIVRVELNATIGVDPNIAFDDIIFELQPIDIKPWSFPNSINLGDQGLLPVAIFGSDTFDVTNINQETIELGTVGMTTRGSAKAPKLAYSFEDVNGDGYIDLVAFFSIPDLVAGGVLTVTTTALTLTATLFDATPIQGTDSVRVVPP